MADTIRCVTCGATVSVGHKFCGGCGGLLNPEGGEGAPRRTWYSLRLVKEDGSDGELFELSDKGALIGRTEGQIRFPHDPTVSPMHAALRYVQGRLVVRDLKSSNGTFVRIDNDVVIKDGDVFQCGEQFLRFEMVSWLQEAESGEVAAGENMSSPGGAPKVKFFGTPRRAWRYKLIQLLAGHEHGTVFCSVSPVTVIGRESTDLNFPTDRYISGRHCSVEQRGTLFYLNDLSSRNGTFLKVKGERTLKEGDSLFLGRQLLRVETRSS